MVQVLSPFRQPLDLGHGQQHGGVLGFHRQHLAFGIQRGDLLLVALDFLRQLLRKHFPHCVSAASKGNSSGVHLPAAGANERRSRALRCAEALQRLAAAPSSPAEPDHSAARPNFRLHATVKLELGKWGDVQ